MANRVRSEIAKWLKRFRNLSMIAVGVFVVASTVLHEILLPPGRQIPDALAIILGLSIPFLFLLQLTIVLLVGKPKPSSDVNSEEMAPRVYPAQVEDVAFDDWLGSNAYLRLVKFMAFFVVLYLYLLLRYHHVSLPWWSIVIGVVVTIWSLTYSIARISFQKDGVRFESASHRTLGFGRSMFVAYHELTIRQGKLWVGNGTTTYQAGRHLYFINPRQWFGVNYLSIVGELCKRLPPNQCRLLPLYRN